ncbi:MAG: RNA 2',3'-cyclic phosphodiesterase [Rhodospirillales bacterium]
MRLFIGLALPREVRLALAAVQYGLPGARWVKPESLHLTLRFLGDVDRGQAEDVDAALSDIVAPSFDLEFSGLGCFEGKDRVRALWTPAVKSCDLKHLQEKIESAVVRAGFEPERRKFKPHVTLARFKNGSSTERVGMFLENHNTLHAGPFTIGHFTLFRSHLGREGSVYEPLVEYPLYVKLLADA